MSTRSLPVKCPDEGDCVNGKYDLIKKLGEGGFGAVFECVDKKTKKHYAMKVELEAPAADEPGLETEGTVLKRLQGYEHILAFVELGNTGSHAFLVMTLAGSNVSELRKSRKDRCFTNHTTLRCAVQSLEAIESVHLTGLLHRDIKPANLAIGKEGAEIRVLYILDFGLVRRHVYKNGMVRPARSSAGFRGSVRYASTNCHNHKDLGRVDDLWSWMYSVVELKKGTLPWSNIDSMSKTGSTKENTPCEVLLESMEAEYLLVYKNLLTLKYESCPPYQMYKDEFAKMSKRKNYQASAPFDWEAGGENYVHTKYAQKYKKDPGEKVFVKGKSKRDDQL